MRAASLSRIRLSSARNSIVPACTPRRHRFFSTHPSPLAAFDPLRILFCGADDFSIYSLQALNRLRLDHPETIRSIEVLCRPDKRTGRGLKKIQAVPIKAVATEQLGSTLHQIDTFTGWTPPSPFDLIVAVSFGLLVPSRLLQAAKYGGLNVHPSLLPDLRGPAPIQHALLQHRTHTGVTLQTMHPKRFDHGQILAQTHQIPIPDESTPNDLIHLLGPLGANLLVKGIQEGLFLEQNQKSSSPTSSPNPSKLSHAPKITPSDREINWQACTPKDLLVRDRVLGRLWDTTTYAQCMGPGSPSKRITFHGPWRTKEVEGTRDAGSVATMFEDQDAAPVTGIYMADGRTVAIPEAMTIEGEEKGKGMRKVSERLWVREKEWGDVDQRRGTAPGSLSRANKER